ncbi:MAG: choice-of-anchor P family protein, partial [Nocardioidaceae bacterium]
LNVNGHPAIGANVAANTQVKINGLGTLYLHRVIHRSNSIEIRMIELVVTQTNPRGLPIGSDIKVSVAEASAH